MPVLMRLPRGVPMSIFRLALLGRFELTGPDGAVDLTSKKLIGLIAYLACTAPQPQGRERLMALLWGSNFEAQARQNLRQAMTRLRRALGPTALLSNGESVSLNPDVITCDVSRFHSLIRTGAQEALAEAVGLYRDRLLADIAIQEEAWLEWIAVERQHLEDLALDALVKLGECQLRTGDAEGALRAGRRAAAINDLREDAHRLIIRGLAAGGRRVEAIKHYDRLCDLLKRELDVAPDSVTKRLVDEMRAETGPPQASSAAAVADREPLVPAPIAPVKPISRSFWFRPAAVWPWPSPVVLAAGGLLLMLAVGAALTWAQLWETRIETASVERMAFPLPDKPSIAVLPFTNLSPAAAEDLTSKGLTESLVNALARNPALFVSAHSSTSAYAGQPAAAKRAAEELGVRYIVEGSVKRVGERVRVTTQLVDALSGRVLWSERYQRTAKDVLALEEEITTRIARSLDVRIIYGSERAAGGTRSLDAWAAYVKGRTEYLKFTKAGILSARQHLLQALQLDPNYAEAMVALANTYFAEMGGARKDAWASALAKIDELDRRAAQIEPRMPRLHELRSMMALTRGDNDLALAEAEAMVELDPNGAESHYVLGRMYFFNGQYERAIDSLNRAVRINPHSRASYSSHLAFSHLALGRVDVAIDILEAAAERWPDYSAGPAFLAILYQLAGREAEARQQIALLPRVAPDISMLVVERRFQPMQDRRLADRIIAAARQAGIPDQPARLP